MSYPVQREIEIPLLKTLDRLGGEAKPMDIYPEVAKYFPALTEVELTQRMESTPSVGKWNNIVQWTRQSLVTKNELDGSQRGIWKITELGRKRLLAEGDTATPLIPPSSEKYTLRDLVYNHQQEVKDALINQLKSQSPESFENFCKVLLEHVGFEDLHITNRGADKGIDGFGSFRQGVVKIRSAFQAKRFKETAVSRPEIDKFRGAIQGDYDHGVFLTTSRFTKDAEDSSVKKGAITILLLDGASIADLMIKFNLGVKKAPIYLAEFDEEFFNEEQ